MHEINFQRLKWQNVIVTIVAMIAIFGIYIFSVSKASESDNIGILIVPFIILIVYGPLASFIYATVRAFQLRKAANGSLWAFITIVFKQVPGVFQALGLIGTVTIVAIGIAGGSDAFEYIFEFVFFPFWAVESLF